MEITKRFINYTKFDTQSAEDSETVPDTPKQLIFAKYPKGELEREGLKDIEMDEMGYICATLPANTEKRIPTIGFISCYNTVLDASGTSVNARIVENYDGGDIQPNPNMVSSPRMFPELSEHKGEGLIVTDGTTLLSADDKAGIAEIVQAICFLHDHDGIEHGGIRIILNPDEEVDMGTYHFGVEKFGYEWGYTIDGGDLGEFEYENFNVAGAKVFTHGVGVHTGCTEGKMVNASRLVCEFNNMIPETEVLEKTENYQGFYYLIGTESCHEEAKLSYITRDHNRGCFEDHKRFMESCVERMNEKCSEETVGLKMNDQYYNMKEKIDPDIHVIELALQAMQQANVTPEVRPICGGMGGTQPSSKDLPCPNIFAGGINSHGPCKFVSAQAMEKAIQVTINIRRLTAEFND